MQRANLDWKRGFEELATNRVKGRPTTLPEKGKELLMKLQTSSI